MDIIIVQLINIFKLLMKLSIFSYVCHLFPFLLNSYTCLLFDFSFFFFGF